ncbi:hypothetical protein D0Z00_000616 [Geotrichum galactomycetum]|uniref:Uncharacterized protein n=1 Tax=Geotrichum galactomycetum TaxID=27317 RepID=A0ACB6V9K5_9ASCO|nr:hypothetical protein D0Z00_000616 [Geotrichum candidum]
MSNLSNSTFKLNSGYEIPRVGLGFYLTSASDASGAVVSALESGYRHIDSAKFYENERDAVEGILRFLETPGNTVKREDIFYTTKIWNDDHGYEQTTAAIAEALDKLSGDSKPEQKDRNLAYIDLVLIHSPYSNREKRLGSWKALQEAVKAGKIKSIGVSNYGIPHLEELLNWEGLEVKPAINQIELHPWLQRTELVEYLRKHDIVPEAYTPLTRGQKLNDPQLLEFAKRYNKSPAQILIKWSLQAGFVTLPKSVNPDRIKANIDIDDFELTPEDFDKLGDKTSVANSSGWDPTTYPVDALVPPVLG